MFNILYHEEAFPTTEGSKGFIVTRGEEIDVIVGRTVHTNAKFFCLSGNLFLAKIDEEVYLKLVSPYRKTSKKSNFVKKKIKNPFTGNFDLVYESVTFADKTEETIWLKKEDTNFKELLSLKKESDQWINVSREEAENKIKELNRLQEIRDEMIEEPVEERIDNSRTFFQEESPSRKKNRFFRIMGD